MYNIFAHVTIVNKSFYDCLATQVEDEQSTEPTTDDFSQLSSAINSNTERIIIAT